MLLILYFFIFLFCLYALCRDDLVLLRKNITLEWLFNTAFATIFMGLISARFVYVLFHFEPQILSFKGLSFPGGILGGILFLMLFLKNKKAPTEHILDSFSTSLIASILISLIVAIFSTKVSFKELTFLFLIIEFVLYGVLFMVFFRLFHKARFKEGSIALLFLVIFSILSFGWDILVKKINILSLEAYEDYLLIAIFLISIFFFIKKEELLKGLKLKKRVYRTLRKFDL